MHGNPMLPVRLSPSQRELLKAGAETQGVTLTEFIRGSALDRAFALVFPHETQANGGGQP